MKQKEKVQKEGESEGCGPEAKELEAAGQERPGNNKQGNSASKIQLRKEVYVPAGSTSQRVGKGRREWE